MLLKGKLSSSPNRCNKRTKLQHTPSSITIDYQPGGASDLMNDPYMEPERLHTVTYDNFDAAKKNGKSCPK